MSIVLLIVLTLVSLGLTLLGGSVGTYLGAWARARAAPVPGLEERPKFKINITWLDVIYGAAMIAGILAKDLWDSLNEEGALRLRWEGVIGALLVSPVVYAGVYSRFVKGELSLLGLAIAFQNGFFWQAVFNTARGAIGTTPGVGQSVMGLLLGGV
jgi:hypothetical protein